MSKYYIVILISILFLQYSCISDANFEIEGADSRIFLYSEFEPGQDLSFKYSTAVGLNDLTPEINPTLTTDFEYVFKEGSEILDPSFRYDVATGLFVSPFNAQDIKTGTFYSVRSHLMDHPELPEITATTFIPEPKEFIHLEEVNDASSTFGDVHTIEKDLLVATDKTHSHYEIEAYLINTKLVGNIQKLNISTTYENKGLIEIPQRNSILVESKELNNQFVPIHITADIDATLLDSNPGIFIKLKTVTPEHYRYHITLAKELESIYAPLSEPVVNFTNVENGIGLFSGFSSTIDTLAF